MQRLKHLPTVLATLAVLVLSLGCIALPFGAEAQDLYDSTRIVDIRIQFDRSDWHQVLDSMKMAGSNERLPATVTIDGKTFKRVGVRYKGNSSFKNPRSKGHRKLPFNLKADEEIKDQTFPGGYKTIKLSNVFQDPSFVREILSYEIARTYMPASRCNFARVWVNDEYLGLYNNTQSVDEVFLEQHFGTHKGTFIKCDPEYDVIRSRQYDHCPRGDKASLMYLGEDPDCYKGWYELESKSNKGWQELIDLVRLLNSRPEDIHTAMNVDAVLWMHAFNNVVVNLDSYIGRLSHNYYLYRTPDSLFTPIVWDMNISLGGFRWDGEKNGELTNEELQTYSLFAHYKSRNPKRPLITNLLANPLYRKIYVGHCRTIVNDWFANGAWLARAKEVQALIDEAVKNDPHKLYTYEDFKKNLYKTVDTGLGEVIGLVELFTARTEYLVNHPLFNGANPVFQAVTHKVSSSGVDFTARVRPAEQVYLVWRRHTAEPFHWETMTPAGEHTWQFHLDEKAGLEYYIVAEGDRLAVCSPEGASWKTHKVLPLR